MPDPFAADSLNRYVIYARNLKGNWYIPFLSIAFFILTVKYDGIAIITIVSAFIAMTIGMGFIEPVSGVVKKCSVPGRIFCLISSLGIFFGCQNHVYELGWSFIFRGDLQGIILLLFLIVAIFAALVFIFLCTSYLISCILSLFREYGLFDDISRVEWIAYVVLMIISVVYITFVYLGSNVFYGDDIRLDLVYTGDSQSLFNGNAYLNNWHLENDLRQPLFAVFASPAAGPVFLIEKIVPLPASFSAALLGCTQIILLFVSCLMLTRIMDLDRHKRICFILIFHSTYTFLLFSIMLEQYVTAFFWIMLCMYGIANKKEAARPALFGACGTLLTSAAIFPLSFGIPGKGKTLTWISKIICSGLGFILLVLAFGKLSIFTGFRGNVSSISSFAGDQIGIYGRICQFSAFVKDYFVAPDAGICTIIHKGKQYISWQLLPVDCIDIAGIMILLISVVSLVINRDRIISRMAGYWILFSMAVLVGFGWGTPENGLILYALYFGWPYPVLLFQLVEWITEKIRIRWVLPVICSAAIIVMLAFNIPGLVRLTRYMFSYYPA